jgi:hypothetical protein
VTQLEPEVQITAIICGTLILMLLIMRVFYIIDFWMGASKWCVRYGCNYAEHPGYRNAVATLPARHRGEV